MEGGSGREVGGANDRIWARCRQNSRRRRVAGLTVENKKSKWDETKVRAGGPVRTWYFDIESGCRLMSNLILLPLSLFAAKLSETQISSGSVILCSLESRKNVYDSSPTGAQESTRLSSDYSFSKNTKNKIWRWRVLSVFHLSQLLLWIAVYLLECSFFKINYLTIIWPPQNTNANVVFWLIYYSVCYKDSG